MTAILSSMACQSGSIGDAENGAIDIESASQEELEAVALACDQARAYVRDCFVTSEPLELTAPCNDEPSLASAESILAMSCDEMYETLGLSFAAHCDRDCSFQSDCPFEMYCGYGTGCFTATGKVCWDTKYSGDSCNLPVECQSGYCDAECRWGNIGDVLCLTGWQRTCR